MECHEPTPIEVDLTDPFDRKKKYCSTKQQKKHPDKRFREKFAYWIDDVYGLIVDIDDFLAYSILCKDDLEFNKNITEFIYESFLNNTAVRLTALTIINARKECYQNRDKCLENLSDRIAEFQDKFLTNLLSLHFDTI